MIIQYMSDLHTEFYPFAIPSLVEIDVSKQDKDTVLVLPGDIASGNQLPVYLRELSPRYKAIVCVLGNHEYYGRSMTTLPNKIKEAVADLKNVHVLDRDTKIIDGVPFIGATLWTNMNNGDPLVMYNAHQAINDYKKIRHGTIEQPYKNKISANFIAYMNKLDACYIEDELDKYQDKQCVVVTHHAPCYQSIDKKYTQTAGGVASTHYYASDYTNLMLRYAPICWFHGHTHSIVDIEIYDTRVLCNARGYAPNDVHKDFDPYKFVEI